MAQKKKKNISHPPLCFLSDRELLYELRALWDRSVISHGVRLII